MGAPAEPVIGATPIARLLYAGRYGDLLAATLDGEAAGCEPPDLAFVVGALCFVGRRDEAELLLDGHRRGRAPVGRTLAAGGFFVTLACARSGEVEQARATLLRAVRETAGGRDAWSRAFLLQGAAACHFFAARYGRAARAARAALASAQAARFAYVQMLATDLRAHVLLQRGELDEGLRLLEQARNHARNLSLDVNARVIGVSIALERAQASHPARALEILEAAQGDDEDGGIQDGYSRRLLLVERARCHALVGSGDAARREVEEAARLATRDPRARLSIARARADVARVTGGWAAARPHIEEAARLAAEAGDPSSLAEAAGLRLGCATWLGLEGPRQEAARLLEALHEEHRLYRAASWLHQHGAAASTAPVDEFGRALQPVVATARQGIESREAVQAVLRTGLWGLLPEACGLAPARRIHLFEDAEVIELEGEVRRLEGLPPRGRAILVALGRRGLSREALLRTAWGMSPYRPDRHDAVIKTTVSRLRTALGKDVLWIETVEGGYQLAEGVEVAAHGFQLTAEPGSLGEVAALAEAEPGRPAPEDDDARRTRWARIARALGGGEELAPAELARTARASVRTVSRDLSEMHRRGLVLRLGEGRSTRYRGAPLATSGPAPQPTGPATPVGARRGTKEKSR